MRVESLASARMQLLEDRVLVTSMQSPIGGVIMAEGASPVLREWQLWVNNGLTWVNSGLTSGL